MGGGRRPALAPGSRISLRYTVQGSLRAGAFRDGNPPPPPQTSMRRCSLGVDRYRYTTPHPKRPTPQHHQPTDQPTFRAVTPARGFCFLGSPPLFPAFLAASAPMDSSSPARAAASWALTSVASPFFFPNPKRPAAAGACSRRRRVHRPRPRASVARRWWRRRGGWWGVTMVVPVGLGVGLLVSGVNERVLVGCRSLEDSGRNRSNDGMDCGAIVGRSQSK